MSRILRRTAASGALLASLLTLAATSPARAAYALTDINNWDLYESVTTYGGGTQFHISSGGDGWANYRWLDVTTHTTVISGNACSDYSLYGSHQFNAGVTAYRSLFYSASSGLCFVLRGRTANGSGAMYNKDGRLAR